MWGIRICLPWWIWMCSYNRVFKTIKLMFRQQKNLKWCFHYVILGKEKAYGQIHIEKTWPRPVRVGKAICCLMMWVWGSDLILIHDTWLGQEGWPWGHNSLPRKSHEGILSGLDIGPYALSHVLSFLFPSSLPFPLLHLQLLASARQSPLHSALAYFSVFDGNAPHPALSIAGVLYLESKDRI